MLAIFIKDIASYFSSFYKVGSLALLLIVLNIFLWLIPSYSILEYGYADLGLLFELLPFVLLFLIPSMTMDLFVDDFDKGTSDLLFSKPVPIWKVWSGHFLFVLFLVILFLALTLTCCYTIYQIKAESGIIDGGQIFASYMGVLFIAVAFLALSLFCSSFSKSQAGAFLLSVVFCYCFYALPGLMSDLPVFHGGWDYWIKHFSVDTHFYTLGKGLFEVKSLLYILSLVALFSFYGVRNISWRMR